jgi:hypothetical protein
VARMSASEMRGGASARECRISLRSSGPRHYVIASELMRKSKNPEHGSGASLFDASCNDQKR